MTELFCLLPLQPSMSDSQEYYTPAERSSAEVGSSTTSSREPVLNKTIRRPRFTEKIVLNLVARRYGSLHDFSTVVARWCDISRATGVHQESCRRAVLLFHKRGNRFLKVNASNYPMGRPRVMPPELERQLCSKETLYEMRFLSLARRVELIRREHGIVFGDRGLAKLYKRNGVRYLQASKIKRLPPSKERTFELERISFARKLHGLQQLCGEEIVYMDETTFLLWPKPGKTWQKGPKTIGAPENLTFYSAITLFGAVGKAIEGGKFFMTAPATDIPSVQLFLVELARRFRNQYGLRPWLVWDNAGAHRSDKVKPQLDRYRVAFQPSYSSQFNVVEWVWSSFKRAHLTRIHRRDRDFANAEEFR